MRALALLLAAAVLAGCTGSPFGGGAFTAKEAQGQGDPHARQWRADAVLAGLVGPEARQGSEFLGNESSDWPGAPQPDGNVGDGRLPQWFLHYVSPQTGASLGVVVYANGTVVSHEDRGGDRDGPLGEWSVDSPQAVQVAMQDANFSAAVRASDGGALYALGPGEGGAPFWILTAGSEGAGTGAIVFVNARTGERLNVPFFGGGFPLPGFPFSGGPGSGDTRGCNPSSSNAEGTLGFQMPQAELPFEVQEGCSTIEADLEWDGTLPTDRVTLEVRDPSGTALGAMQEDGTDTSYAATYPARGPGTYTAVVTLASEAPAGVGADYRLIVNVPP